jgi:hypothetical protein
MIQSATMKQSLRYDQISCRLQLDGLPDVSAGQSSEAIGILTSWSLEWLGRPQLEGRREHLEALMGAVLPYARNLISGVARPSGNAEAPVSIEPAGEGHHRLQLRSSQPGIEPLQLELDDAELADLVRVLDQVRLDPRLQLPLPLPHPRPLRHRELTSRTPLARRVAAPLGGALALALAAGVASLLPLPPRSAPEAAPRRETSTRQAPPSPPQAPPPLPRS